MLCSNCDKEIPDGSEFCSYCGAKQEELLFCYKCGHEIPADSDFCQFCGTTQPNRPQNDKNNLKEKKKVKKGLIAGIVIAAILIIAAVIVFVVIKPFDGTKTDNSVLQKEESVTTEDPFESMSLEEKVAQSKDVSISGFRSDFESLTKQNVHLSGYVVNTDDWATQNTIDIADSLQWPYETTDMGDYYGKDTGGLSFDEWQQMDDAWQTVTKTPAVTCKLKDNGVAEGIPKEGDIVDVYCIVTQGTIKAFPYYITVR